MKKPFPTVPPLFASTLYWIFLFSFLQQLLLVNPPSLSSPLTQTATNSGLFLAHVRCVCVYTWWMKVMFHTFFMRGKKWWMGWVEERLRVRQKASSWEDTCRDSSYYTKSEGLRETRLTPKIPTGAAHWSTRSWRSTGHAAPDNGLPHRDEGWQEQPYGPYRPIKKQCISLGQKLKFNHMSVPASHLYGQISRESWRADQRWENS